MSATNSHDFRGAPSVIHTAGPSKLVRTLDFLAGPLALAAAGLTFFMAYELTVAQPAGLLAIVEPVPNHPVAAPQPQQADAKTISMVGGAAPKGY